MCLSGWKYGDKCAFFAFVIEPNESGYSCEEGVVFSSSDIDSRFEGSASLANQNRSALYELAPESFDSQPF